MDMFRRYSLECKDRKLGMRMVPEDFRDEPSSGGVSGVERCDSSYNTNRQQWFGEAANWHTTLTPDRKKHEILSHSSENSMLLITLV
jgi:hypothetical protein